ncbi:MAG: type II secretion system protein [Thermodesulfobacteriota bacterium]|nr:type II secretion system protein [Thermodesulfobacteriota bacterium]
MNSTNPKGFTLLEILIAICILAVILSTIFTSYTGTFRITEHAESQAEIYGMARVALQRIRDDLESVYISTIPPSLFMGKDQEVQGASADTLRFLSRSHVILDEGEEDPGIAEIIYYVREDDEKDGLILYRSDTPQFAHAPEDYSGGMVLCDTLFSVDFKYYDSYGEAYERWDSAGEGREYALPSRVSIFLAFLDRSNPEVPMKFMTGVALPVVRDEYGKIS